MINCLQRRCSGAAITVKRTAPNRRACLLDRSACSSCGWQWHQFNGKLVWCPILKAQVQSASLEAAAESHRLCHRTHSAASQANEAFQLPYCKASLCTSSSSRVDALSHPMCALQRALTQRFSTSSVTAAYLAELQRCRYRSIDYLQPTAVTAVVIGPMLTPLFLHSRYRNRRYQRVAI
jgi:hypothetical protein